MYHRCNVIASSLQRIKKRTKKRDEHEIRLGKDFLPYFIPHTFRHGCHGGNHQRDNSPTDKPKEPLTGATVQVSGTAQGAVADLDGNYTLELKNGTYTLTVRYIGYKDMTIMP